MAGELDSTIRDNATGPAKASSGGVSMEQHSLPDQMAADKYLAGKHAMKSPSLGLRKAKIVPPSAR